MKMIKFTNYLIWIFMNINEYLKNKRKFVESKVIYVQNNH